MDQLTFSGEENTEDLTARLKILIVDDSEYERALFKRFLETDYDILEAENGRDAMFLLTLNRGDIALILLDYVMPVMDGKQVLEKMNEMGWIEDIPVIMISSEESDDVIKTAYNMGVTDFINKNIRRTIINKRVSNTIRLFAKQRLMMKLIQEENTKLQFMDKLTGIYNMSGFRINALAKIKNHPELQFAITYVDIKGFKFVNDLYGVEKANELLCYWVSLFRDVLEENEIIGRVGADCLVALTVLHEKYKIDSRFEDIAYGLSHYLDLPGRSYSLELSSGSYIVMQKDYLALANGTLDIDKLISHAILARDKAKRRPGTCHEFFNDDEWMSQWRGMMISKSLEDALLNREISLWLQPQFSYTRQRVISAEALCRWNHSELGFISPGDFIPVLESTGQIYALDKFIWEEVCKLLKQWQSHHAASSLSISINISRADITASESPDAVIFALVDKYGLSSRNLHVEITESAYVEDTENIIKLVNSFHSRGFIVEMDDFGSGYSSLNSLKDIDVDVVKLDMGFLYNKDKYDTNRRSGKILDGIIKMAKNLGISVIAEGIETVEQAEFLGELGCNIMQGYFFYRPLIVADFTKIFIDQDYNSEILAQLNRERKKKELKQIVLRQSTLMGLNSLNDVQRFEDIFVKGSNSSYIFEHYMGSAAIVSFNHKNYNINVEEVNDAFLEQMDMEYSAGDFLKKGDLSVFTNTEQNILRDDVLEAYRSGNFTSEFYFSAADRWILINFRVIFKKDDSTYFICNAMDCTENHNNMESYRVLCKELRMHLNSLPAGLLRYEAEGEQKFSYVSDGLLEMLGFPNLESFKLKFNNSFNNMIYEEDRERVQKEISVQISKNGKTDFCKYRIKTAEGNLKWVYDCGNLVTDEKGKKWYYVVVADMNYLMVEREKENISRERLQFLSNIEGFNVFEYTFANDTLKADITRNNGYKFSAEIAGFISRMLRDGLVDSSTASKIATIHAQAMDNTIMDGNIRVVCRFKGEFFHTYRCYFICIHNSIGTPERLLGYASNTDEEEKDIIHWKDKALRDSMTGLLNHDATILAIEKKIASKDFGTVVLFDVDDFKIINDTFGHFTGDSVLIRIADRLKTSFRQNDIVGRYGGDEFVVYLSGLSDVEDVKKKLDFLLEELNNLTYGKDSKVSCSMGAVICDENVKNVRDVMSRADEELYKVKQAGKNGFSLV